MENNTINGLLTHGKSILRGAGIESYSLDAQILLSYVSGLTKTQLYTSKQYVAHNVADSYLNHISQRAANKPIAYITGEKEFMSLDFAVDENVLIPRPDTEILVETVLRFSERFGLIVDIGTGSGCIPISLCHYSKKLFSIGVDISSAAIQTAKNNAQKNNVECRTSFFIGDLFTPLPDEICGYVDAVVSNPPYIPKNEADYVAPTVINYEPHNALFADDNGLYFYKKIAALSPKYLNQNGMLFFEIAYNQADLVTTILKQNNFINIEIVNDLAGNNRVIFGTMGQ